MLTGTGAAATKARKLRPEMSLPEVLLWKVLRTRPGGFKFRRQQPAGQFIVDFACLEARLLIEIDGAVHERGGNLDRDEARDRWLMEQGYRVVRIPAQQVLSDVNAVAEYVVEKCRSCQPLHRPSGGPPPRTGEDHSAA